MVLPTLSAGGVVKFLSAHTVISGSKHKCDRFPWCQALFAPQGQEEMLQLWEKSEHQTSWACREGCSMPMDPASSRTMG